MMPPPQPKNPWARWALDTLERTVRTFLQGMLGVVSVNAFTSLDASWQQTILVGALAGAYAVVSAFVAQPVGASDSASFLPENTDPPQ